MARDGRWADETELASTKLMNQRIFFVPCFCKYKIAEKIQTAGSGQHRGHVITTDNAFPTRNSSGWCVHEPLNTGVVGGYVAFVWPAARTVQMHPHVGAYAWRVPRISFWGDMLIVCHGEISSRPIQSSYSSSKSQSPLCFAK